MICDRPEKLSFDFQNNRLNAKGEPAIEYSDGWAQYYYFGEKLPDKTIETQIQDCQEKQLRELTFNGSDDYQLQEIPPEIFKLEHLKKLNLNNK